MKFSCTFTDFSLPAGPSVGCVLVAMLAFTSFLFLARTAYNIYSLHARHFSLTIEEESLPFDLASILTPKKKKNIVNFFVNVRTLNSSSYFIPFVAMIVVVGER